MFFDDQVSKYYLECLRGYYSIILNFGLIILVTRKVSQGRSIPVQKLMVLEIEVSGTRFFKLSS